MNPTPRDRFQGALMGGLLGPIYDLHYAQQDRRESHETPKLQRSQPRQLTPTSEALLHQYWTLLATAGETALERWALGIDELEPLATNVSAASPSALEEQLLIVLPEALLRTSWLSAQQSLGRRLCTGHKLTAGYPVDLDAIWAKVDTVCQRLSHHGELAVMDWLYSSDEALRELSSLASLGQAQRRLGAQLIALNLGSSQGSQGFPWIAKTWLGEWYAPLLNLGDRLYAAWSGQTDFEKLGVSCEGSLLMATPII